MSNAAGTPSRPSRSCASFPKQIRQSARPALLAANEREVSRLTLAPARDVAHAFSLFFHLVNLCEERQRVRRLRSVPA